MKTKKIVTTAMLVAAATVLGLIKIFALPFGGDVTLASLMPILIAAYLYDTKHGLLTAFVYSLIKMLFDFRVVGALFLPGESQMAVISALSVCILDYIVAYTALGLSGIFKSKIKNDVAAISAGSLFALILHYIIHVISGAIFYGAWAEWFFSQEGFYSVGSKILDTFSGVGLSIVYSVFYNGLYMLPEIIITMILIPIVYAALKKSNVL